MATKKKAAKKKPLNRIIIEVRLNSNGRISNATAARALTDLHLFEARTDDQVGLDIKTIILAVLRDKKTRPEDLQDDDKLEDIGFDSDLLNFLHIALNNYVRRKKTGAKISNKEIKDCETVGDCITLVKAKI